MNGRFREPLHNPAGAAGYDKNLMNAAFALATYGGPGIIDTLLRASQQHPLEMVEAELLGELAASVRHVFVLNQRPPEGWRFQKETSD